MADAAALDAAALDAAALDAAALDAAALSETICNAICNFKHQRVLETSTLNKGFTKPTHFAIIMLRVTALPFFANMAFDSTYLPRYMTSIYLARTTTAVAYYRLDANMWLVRIALNFLFGLVLFSGARPLAKALVRGLQRDEERASDEA